jgi:hypothetical protein
MQLRRVFVVARGSTGAAKYLLKGICKGNWSGPFERGITLPVLG